MRYRLIILFSFLLLKSFQSPAQISPPELELLKKLDSLSASASPAAPFADLYFSTMINALHFFEKADDSSRACIRILQAKFAQSFFAAADSFALQKSLPESWQNYYNDTSMSALRHVLLGINAHINGDIWQSLISSFTYEKLIAIRPLYFSYYHGLLDVYDQVYDKVFSTNRSLRFLHSVSLGVDKWYGKRLLYRWLKRQMTLACLYYRSPDRFRKKHARLLRKMNRLDRAIKRHF
jgi:hypothetical protein